MAKPGTSDNADNADNATTANADDTKNVALSRCLIRTVRSGALATIGRRKNSPHSALVTLTPDHRGQPVFLFSRLSGHTRNLQAHPEASLLLADVKGFDNPQAAPRISLNGRITPAGKDAARTLKARFLRFHPEARLYAGFADFTVWRMAVDRVHLVGGFARAAWLDAASVLCDPAAARTLTKVEEDVLEHMNTDHADAVVAMGRAWGTRRGKRWRMIGVDPDGCDLRLGKSVYRIWFDAPAASAEDVRGQLIRLAKRAGSVTRQASFRRA